MAKRITQSSPPESRFVAVDRVLPLVSFLERVYGTLREVSTITGVPDRTLRKIRRGEITRVEKRTALKIVQAVKTHRHGDRTWSLYENDVPAHLATPREQGIVKVLDRHDQNWKPVKK